MAMSEYEARQELLGTHNASEITEEMIEEMMQL